VNAYEDLGRATAGRAGEWVVIVTLVTLVVVATVYVGILAQNVINAFARNREWADWKDYYTTILWTSMVVLLMVAEILMPKVGVFSSKLGTYVVIIIFCSFLGISASIIPTQEPCDPPHARSR